MTNHYIAMVDPYSSGKYLADEIHSRGIPCVAIKSTKKSLAFGEIANPDVFTHIFEYSDGGDQLIEKLIALGVTTVIAGCESGVTLADALNAALGFKSNDTRLSSARRNKYIMQNRLAEAGLRSIRQALVSSVNEAFTEAEMIGFPVILKPFDSAGSDHVVKCNNAVELKEAFEKAFGAINRMGSKNTQLLIQEYLDGIEYMIDTVSMDGQHHTTNICQYHKVSLNGSDVVYREMSFIRSDDPISQSLTEYNDLALDALGINIGAAHSEIMMTSSGPVLIEAGARMCGGNGPKIVQEIAKTSQIDLSLDSYIDPESFKNKTKFDFEYHSYAKVFYLVGYEQGYVDSINREEIESKLHTLFDPYWNIAVGDRVQETRCLFTCPVWFVLVSDDLDKIEQDQKTLLAFENAGQVYSVASTVEV